MSQIGRLLQGGILGGAQAYEDAARLHLAQEQARRDAQFDPVRMQNLQAELEDRRSRAERMRRGEAATKQVFEFMRAQRGRNQPGMVGPPAPAVDPFVALPVETLNDADPRVLEAVMGDFENEAAATRNVDEVRNRIAGAQQQGLVDFLPKEVWEPGLQMGLIRPQELAKNASFQRENGDKEADKRQALIDLLATRRQPDGSLAFDAMSATRFAGMSLPQLEMQAKIMEANEKAAAVRAEQAQQQAALEALPGEAGNRVRMAAGVTGKPPTANEIMGAYKPGDGQPVLSPAGTLDVLRRRYEASFGKEPPTEEEREAAKADPAKAYEWKWIPGASREFVEASKAKVAAYDALAQAEDQFMRGGGAPAATNPAALLANADDATLEQLDAEFVRRFGVESDPSNPDHVQKMRSLAAEMQRGPTANRP